MKKSRLVPKILPALAAGLVLAGTAAAANPVGMNDVSMLLPIPKSAEDLKANYLNGATMLTSGALVSSATLKLFDWKTTSADIDLRKRENIERLVVLGIRLDPCFKDLFTDACRPQIRLIAQEAVFGGDQTGTADVGVHLFFDTTGANVRSLISFAADYRTKALGAGSAKAILQAQPIITQEGMIGKFWTAFRPQLLNVLGQAKLTRSAFFTVLPTTRDWMFRSFDIQDGVATPLAIAGVKEKFQPVDNQSTSTVDFLTSSADLPRATPATDQTFDYLRDSAEFRRSGDSRVKPFQVTLERLENPTVHLPGTIDCLSCHSTPAIKSSLRKAGIATVANDSTFVTKTAGSLFNLYETRYEARDLRLFGYRDRSPIVGQRVINESAAIVDSLNLGR